MVLTDVCIGCRWNNLREMVDQKRDEINVAHGFQNFNIECNETIVSTPLFTSIFMTLGPEVELLKEVLLQLFYWLLFYGE